MPAEGAAPGYVGFWLAMAPATQVGWAWVGVAPVVLPVATTVQARSPVAETLWYSTTPTRTPAPRSPPPLVQSALTVGPAEDMEVRHSASRPRLLTSGSAATFSTAPGGRSTKTRGEEVLT